ncbi:hypothetical protein G7046_g3566 [Stylonectria norvegica]|nr:hypothetical protein G7046_g3566 [Stylonectria norvegica]
MTTQTVQGKPRSASSRSNGRKLLDPLSRPSQNLRHKSTMEFGHLGNLHTCLSSMAKYSSCSEKYCPESKAPNVQNWEVLSRPLDSVGWGPVTSTYKNILHGGFPRFQHMLRVPSVGHNPAEGRKLRRQTRTPAQKCRREREKDACITKHTSIRNRARLNQEEAETLEAEKVKGTRKNKSSPTLRLLTETIQTGSCLDLGRPGHITKLGHDHRQEVPPQGETCSQRETKESSDIVLDPLESGLKALYIGDQAAAHEIIDEASEVVEYCGNDILTIPEAETSDDSDMDDGTYWTWDVERQQFRHWDEDEGESVYCPEVFD